MAVRRSEGFVRYAFSLQYHGLSFLGFPFLGKEMEDCILPNGTDLRGFRTVESRLNEALIQTVGQDNFENIQVSSRTDRGVHALRNTCHVDIRPRKESDSSCWDPKILGRGLNYFLNQQSILTKSMSTSENVKAARHQSRKGRIIEGFPRSIWEHLSCKYSVGMQDLRVLSVARAPLVMLNKFAFHPDEPLHIDWSARFSATQRTYAYRIQNLTGDRQWGIPFEWDRAWRVRSGNPLNVDAMIQASSYLIGTHDFSSFRGGGCQRLSPVVTINNIRVYSHIIGDNWFGLPGQVIPGVDFDHVQESQMVTIVIEGESFLYRQVRNMVASLVEVGRGRLTPNQVQEMLASKSRSAGPRLMAPAHGLFLVDVQHGDFKF